MHRMHLVIVLRFLVWKNQVHQILRARLLGPFSQPINLAVEAVVLTKMLCPIRERRTIGVIGMLVEPPLVFMAQETARSPLTVEVCVVEIVAGVPASEVEVTAPSSVPLTLR